MFSVRVVPTVGPLAAYEIHNLVLSLARDASIGNVYLHLLEESARCDSLNGNVAYILPARVRVKLLNYPVLQ